MQITRKRGSFAKNKLHTLPRIKAYLSSNFANFGPAVYKNGHALDLSTFTLRGEEDHNGCFYP